MCTINFSYCSFVSYLGAEDTTWKNAGDYFWILQLPTSEINQSQQLPAQLGLRQLIHYIHQFFPILRPAAVGRNLKYEIDCATKGKQGIMRLSGKRRTLGKLKSSDSEGSDKARRDSICCLNCPNNNAIDRQHRYYQKFNGQPCCACPRPSQCEVERNVHKLRIFVQVQILFLSLKTTAQK